MMELKRRPVKQLLLFWQNERSMLKVQIWGGQISSRVIWGSQKLHIKVMTELGLKAN